MAYIEFEDVKKIYGTGEAQVRALDGVSFQVEKGEFVVLLGSSGAGKTTLLNMLGGMDTITEGKILFDGRDISHMSGFEMARYRRHDVGFVFQFYNLIPNLTALENVEIAAQLCSNPIPAAQALDMVGLSGRARNFPAQLSGGEQQRVAIARALAAGSYVILADEPTGNLDSGNSRMIVETLQRLAHQEKRCVIVVTHDPAVAAAADVQLRMQDGRLTQEEQQAEA